METEKDRLEREIKVLEEARAIFIAGETTSYVALLKEKQARLDALTRPAIKDGVLGRWTNGKITTRDACKYNDPETDLSQPFWKFIPLTIEELLPTLAQWVPGAVRWRYCDKSHVCIVYNDGYNKDNETHRIPAPPRDDWENVQGEL